MSRTVVEKAVCENCGVDVRENTLFCYNCGSSVSEPAPSGNPKIEPGEKNDTVARINDLADQIKIEPPSDEEKKRAKAAAERKKARINPRKRPEVVWEPVQDTPGRLLLLVALLIALMAGVAVVMTIL